MCYLINVLFSCEEFVYLLEENGYTVVDRFLTKYMYKSKSKKIISEIFIYENHDFLYFNLICDYIKDDVKHSFLLRITEPFQNKELSSVIPYLEKTKDCANVIKASFPGVEYEFVSAYGYDVRASLKCNKCKKKFKNYLSLIPKEKIEFLIEEVENHKC